ncbi:MAG: GFA family protein [Xanthomonadales bacterium]|nr:GFA family protein [Xanthomonadales bacterium]NIN74041.1 GFA family protein [Xanthomonadales bacterium]NIO12427.1 GFA family protein [Xanthomonadales bacterium]NIP11166.1 GFA family protein [Xanthomonadales bacterium]NIP74672.1 GFA family protein [Xanthomonadales bacterium]
MTQRTDPQPTADVEPFTCIGGCHCGAVAFEVDLGECVEVSRCNCSICSMSGYLHVIVERDRFRLLSGRDQLAEYRFNTQTARHLFCRRCGVKSFYVPRSHPDGISVNLSCIDLAPEQRVRITDFDGRHWEENIARLRDE